MPLPPPKLQPSASNPSSISLTFSHNSRHSIFDFETDAGCPIHSAFYAE